MSFGNRFKALGAIRRAAVMAAMASVALVLPAVDSAWAQTAAAWPQRPVRLVVPYLAAGTTDILARILAQKMGDNLGQQFVVENRPGAGGNLGGELVAKSTPDGYTLLVGGPGNFSINQFIYAKMPYVPEKELVGVAGMARIANVFLVANSIPVKTVKEFIEYAKARPGQINYGTPGNGTTGHLSTELFKTMSGTNMVHVPYKGSAGVLAAILSGELQMTIDNLPAYVSKVKDGSVRALGVSTAQRASVLPDVPTIAEAGVPGYEASSWFALAAPAGTPKDLVARISLEANKALSAADVVSRMKDIGAEVIGGTPEETDRFFAAEAAKWKKVAEVSGARAE